MKPVRVGVLGGGQLGCMLALAGYPLGMHFRFYDPSPDAPARFLAECMCGEYGDTEHLTQFVDQLDVVTFEFENVPVSAVDKLSESVPVAPNHHALEISQDRITEKNFLRQCGTPTPDYASIDNLDELHVALEWIGFPAVLKTRRMGYDGKGQTILSCLDDVNEAWRLNLGVPLILEQFVHFDSEVSILAARSRFGEIVSYPLVRNWHQGGILRKSVPIIDESSCVTNALHQTALGYITRIMTALDYIGILALELFETNGHLLANEMAPRVHNSGHWTIEGSETSQFENHMRAILGMPLGSTQTLGYPAMLNLIGRVPDHMAILNTPKTHMHIYGKDARPGRKLGHITIRAQTSTERDYLVSEIEKLIGVNAIG